MTETIAKEVQKLALGPRVELFKVNTFIYDEGPTYYFVNHAIEGGVTFDGQVYSPFPIESSGWSKSKDGALPRPKISVSNISGFFSALCLQYDDLVGVEVTRIVTFKRFLDGESDADPTQMFWPDVYVIARKTAHDNKMISWELTAKMDLEGRTLPGRLMLQGVCLHRYRRWNALTSSFDYSNATCPYTGGAYFRRNGTPTGSPAEDACSKLVSGCVDRFTVANDLPFWGFPGIDRTQT